MRNVMKASMTFAATGDSLTARALPVDYEGFGEISAFIKAAGARLTNLETVISNFDCFPSTYSGGTWVNAPPEALHSLLSFGFNCLGCANNHSMDYSYDGLYSTIREIKKTGVPLAGIGMNLYEASKPAVIELPTARVGVISICSTFNDAARAGEKGRTTIPARPGLNPLRHREVYTVTREQMKVLREIARETKMNGELENSIAMGFTPKPDDNVTTLKDLKFVEGEKNAKHTYCDKHDLARTVGEIKDALLYLDYVVVMTHAHQIRGSSYTEPDEFMTEFAHACIDAGASAVVGGGTHQLQPVEIYNGKPIFYSLGNFLFQSGLVDILPPDFIEKNNLTEGISSAQMLLERSKGGTVGLACDRANYLSVIPYFEAEGGEITKILLKPIELGFNLRPTFKGLPRPADEETAREIFGRLKAMSEPYGTVLEFTDGLISVKIC